MPVKIRDMMAMISQRLWIENENTKERSHHVVEASEQGDVGETHQLRIVNAETDEKKL